MSIINKDTQSKPVNPDNECVYKAPAIIYEGIITTRAGSGPTGDPAGSGESGVDPADLFGDGG
ncbi:MAG: hypothetical protein IAF02_03345 [Anaerolineae bacterium]|nr:hypothetical protein [Anaerolineae bacterium]